MACTTVIQLNQTKKLNQHYQQYLKTYKILNIDFVEWISLKLHITEQEAVNAIKEWKNQFKY